MGKIVLNLLLVVSVLFITCKNENGICKEIPLSFDDTDDWLKSELPICKPDSWSVLLNWEIHLFDSYVNAKSENKRKMIERNLCYEAKSREHYSMFKKYFSNYLEQNPSHKLDAIKLLEKFYLGNSAVQKKIKYDFN